MEIKKIIKNEFSGWNKFEVLWLIISSLTIISLSIYFNDKLIGIICSLAGVIGVVLNGKGKLFNYLFSFINCLLYGVIAYKAHLYGEAILNFLYYVPMQFIGFNIWRKNINNKTHEVNKIHMKNTNRLLLLIVIIVGSVLYAIVLNLLKDAMPCISSIITIMSVVAMFIGVKMYSEQWWLWIIINILEVYIWSINLSNGSDIATLLMWLVYLFNSIIMCIKWEKEVKKNNKLCK